jgi:hypothetical protein
MTDPLTAANAQILHNIIEDNGLTGIPTELSLLHNMG